MGYGGGFLNYIIIYLGCSYYGCAIGKHFHRNNNLKLRSAALARTDVDGSAEHLHYLACYGQSQTYALLALCAGQTGECKEDALLFLRRHSAPRVRNADGQPCVSHDHGYGHFALVGVFNGVAHQIVYHLLYAERIRTTHHRILHAYVRRQTQMLRHGLRLHAVRTLAHKRSRRKAHLMQFRLAALQLVIVQQGGDEL